ncbi:MAG: methyl-accepting chemotaxis protein [Acetobacter fabarum]|jgi:methyl-accepting chemotaxis protein|nr:methyl-accepting chemotaxis protein [Acetobacter fabarum]MCI1928411.1 methyl-accepting chemotaxis protein [Acetobacter fabarum]
MTLPQTFDQHSMGSLAQDGFRLSPTESGSAVMEIFKNHPDTHHICIINARNIPVGVVEKQKFLSLMSSPFSYALYHKRPVTLLMDDSPLMVEARTPILDFTKKILNNKISDINKSFIITHNQCYVGTATPFDLMRMSYLHSNRISDTLQTRTITLHETLHKIQTATHSISAESRSLRDESENLSERNRTQNQHLQESDKRIKSTIEKTQDQNIKMEESRNYIQHASTSIRESCVKINDTIEKFKKISEASEDIGKILNIMKSISSQINILGINATIEASKAGSYGAGFGVVAQEIRSLSHMTSESLLRTRTLISYLQDSIHTCSGSMCDNSQTLAGIIHHVEKIKCSFKEFEETALVQKEEINQLHQIMQKLNVSTAQNNETVHNTNAICDNLFINVSELAQMTSNMHSLPAHYNLQ